MQDRKRIQGYINNFRRRLALHLKPGVGLTCRVYPAEARGAVVECILSADSRNEDDYLPVDKSINVILGKISQRMVGGNLSGVIFSGTNISLEGNRILLIKGEDGEAEWSDDGARSDLDRVLQGSAQAAK